MDGGGPVQAEVLTPSETAAQPRSVDQVRAAFLASGYQVNEAYTWDWTLPSVTSFQVRDPSSDRVVLVLVYQTTTDSDTARRLAEERGPYLIPGYGRSFWSGNVVMVQSTLRELEHVARAETDHNNRLHFDQGIVGDPSGPAIAVDLDFQQALNQDAG